MMYTPESIETLEPDQIFVFGSNVLGQHEGGAAQLALERFGAIYGLGEGLADQSYAFPTLNERYQKQFMKNLEKSRDQLFECAENHSELIFLVTKIGCGIAGFSEEEIKPLFTHSPKNIILPESWETRYERKTL